MIDLHSHLLPGVDDGARSLDQALRVLRQQAEEGVLGVCLTPHLTASHAAEGVPRAHDVAFTQLTASAPNPPVLYRGAEVLLDRPLSDRIGAERQVTLAGSRYLLVEFPRFVQGETVTRALARVVEIGLIPLLAHPERYSSCSSAAVRHWRGFGALMQVDATTLLAHSNRGSRARQLVAEGLADVLAGDNHGDDRTMTAGLDLLRQHGGEMQAELLGATNPRRIIDDQEVEPVPPLPLKESWLRRLRGLFEGEA